MEPSDAFSRIWTAFDAGQILPACAWCGRVRIDETWLLPSPAALAAVDQRYTFSHSICDLCAIAYAPTLEDPPANARIVVSESRMATARTDPESGCSGEAADRHSFS